MTTVRPAVQSDADAACRIYDHHVRETHVTFEESPVSVAEMARRIGETTASGFPWLVAEREGRVVGYAHASPWKSRCAYRHSVETTVYVAQDALGCGVGTALYRDLIDRLRVAGMHAVMGGIALPNEASVALHEKMGFRKVAHFHEVGFKLGRRIDVGYWQLLLGETAPTAP